MVLIKLACIAYVLVFVLIVAFWKRIKMTIGQIKLLFVGFALALSIIALNMGQPSGWDIGRYSDYLNYVRATYHSFLGYVFPSNPLQLRNYFDREFSYLYVFRMIVYLVTRITDNNLLLPAICVFIDYSIMGYIMVDWLQVTGKKSSICLLVLLGSFSFMLFVDASSGIRNSLGASILGLATYLYLVKKNKLRVFVILTIVAALIHPAALMAVPFVFIAKFDIGAWGYIAVFVVSVLVKFAAKWMSSSTILYLRSIGQRYFYYTAAGQYRGSGRAHLYTDTLLIIIFLLVYFICHFNRDRNGIKKHDLIYSFLSVYMVYILGNIGNYDMILRPAYVLGPLSPVLFSLILDNDNWVYTRFTVRQKYIIRVSSYFACLVLLVFLQTRLMPDYISVYLLN